MQLPAILEIADGSATVGMNGSLIGTFPVALLPQGIFSGTVKVKG